jgi:hypothetical protein
MVTGRRHIEERERVSGVRGWGFFTGIEWERGEKRLMGLSGEGEKRGNRGREGVGIAV